MKPHINIDFVVTAEMQQEFLAMRLSMRNRNMTKWIYDSFVKAKRYVFSLDKNNGVSHGGIQFKNYSKHGTAWWHRLTAGG